MDLNLSLQEVFWLAGFLFSLGKFSKLEEKSRKESNEKVGVWNIFWMAFCNVIIMFLFWPYFLGKYFCKKLD